MASNLVPPAKLDDGIVLEAWLMPGGTYEMVLFCKDQPYHRFKVLNWRSDAPTTYTAVSLFPDIGSAVREYQRRCGPHSKLRLVR